VKYGMERNLEILEKAYIKMGFGILALDAVIGNITNEQI
jgi:hypothetical protein